MSYINIIVAISDTFGSQHLQGAEISRLDDQAIAAEIVACQGNMPDYLRVPMRVLTWLFDWAGLIRCGSRFQQLDRPRKLARINAWRNSRIGLCRNFVRFYESLFLLIALQEDAR